MSLTTATCSTQNWNNYNYTEPDIFNEMLAIDSKTDREKEILPQDKYLSKIALKEWIVEKRPEQRSNEAQNKINQKKADFVVGVMKAIKSKLINLDKHSDYSDTYLIKYLDKTEDEQKKEAGLAFSALTSEWSKKEVGKLLSKTGGKASRAIDFGDFCDDLIQCTHEPINTLTSREMVNSTPKEYLVKDEKGELVIRPVFKKIKEIIEYLNENMVVVSNIEAFVDVILKRFDEHEAVLSKLEEQDLPKLQKQTLPKLNERIEDLEHVSTHVVYGLNEEVQKLFEKIARLEANSVDTYFTNENLKNEIANKDTKIAQLASKVDAFQEKILEMNAVNQTQAKTIQEFEERQMKMEEEQRRQRETLDSLIKILESEKK